MSLGWILDPLQAVLAVLVAAGFPAAFLLLIYMLDLYASRTFWLVALCFAWGTGGGAGLAYLINTYITLPLLRYHSLDYLLLYIFLAPLVEEIVKLLPLVYISRRPEFTYFVDGATYGFACGIGFSITENFLYVGRNAAVALPLALLRSFSTCLMHGASTALVGAALGRFRLWRRARRWLLVVAAVGGAIFIHGLFNAVVLVVPMGELLEVLAAVCLGGGGLGMTILFVFLGLREQRRWLVEGLDRHMVDLVNADLTSQERAWLVETLDEQAGVSVAEVQASQAYELLDGVLDPVARQFPRKAKQMERIILRQAQIGIKRRLIEEAEGLKTRLLLEQEVTRLEKDAKRLRREAGVGAMAYLKCVFDENDADLGVCLETLVSCAGALACDGREAGWGGGGAQAGSAPSAASASG